MDSFHAQAHLNAFLQILEYCSQSVDVDGFSLLAYSVFELFDCAGYILYTLLFNRQALDLEIGVAKCFFEKILSLKKTFNFSHAGI